jgi:tetratricopeptide (TPR) repeat protein
MHHLRAACALLLALLFPLSSFGQADLIGKTVLAKDKVAPRSADQKGNGHLGSDDWGTAVVKKVDGDNLWIRTNYHGDEGWVKRTDILTVQEAIAYFTDRIKSAPTDARAWLKRGTAFMEKGERENAIKDFTEAIRLNPKEAHAYNNRGCVYHTEQNYDRAIQDYSEVIRLDPAMPVRGLAVGLRITRRKTTTEPSTNTTTLFA